MHYDHIYRAVAPRFFCARRFALSVLIISLTFSARYAAASSYTVTGETYSQFNTPPYEFDGPNFNETADRFAGDSKMGDVSGTYPGPSRSAFTITADASGGSAHAYSYNVFDRGYTTAPAAYYVNSYTDASATVNITDLIITAPVGAPAMVTTTVRLHVAGSVDATSEYNTGSLGIFSTAGVSADLTVNGKSVGSGAYGLGSDNGNTATPSSSGWLTNFDGDDILTSDAFTVPVNTPFSLRFVLSTSAVIGANDDDTFSALARADFGDTLSFATDRPVFDLPLGYTADSLDAGIIANQFVELPEPSTAAVFATMALLTAARRRRRHELSLTNI